MITLTLLLSGCVTESDFKFIPPAFPEPNHKMTEELEKVCMPQEKCPLLWEWIDRLYKLKDELKVMS